MKQFIRSEDQINKLIQKELDIINNNNYEGTSLFMINNDKKSLIYQVDNNEIQIEPYCITIFKYKKSQYIPLYPDD